MKSRYVLISVIYAAPSIDDSSLKFDFNNAPYLSLLPIYLKY